MCLSCGCGEPNATHGDNRHITLEDLEEAAKAAGITLEEVLSNLHAAKK